MEDKEIRMRCLEIAQYLATKFVIEDRSRLTDIAEDFFKFVSEGAKSKNKPGPKPKK